MEWKISWSYLPVRYGINIGTVKNITQRTFFKNNLDGTKLKIKFSNLYSEKVLILDNVVIGKKNRDKTDIIEMQTITYHGAERIAIGAGTEFYSDEIDFIVSYSDDIVLSIYVKETTDIVSVCATWAAESWKTKYGKNGNFIREQQFEESASFDVYPVLQGDPNIANNLFGITEIKVYTNCNVKTVALFGDSITHMSYYSDALIEKLYNTYPGKITVVNRGLGGNRLLHEYSRVHDVPGGGTLFGTAGISRFFNDIYGSDHPEIVLVLIGTNDFIHPYALKHFDEAITLEEYKDGMKKLIKIAHENGSKIILGTVTPFRSEDVDWFTLSENLRVGANEWIRKQKISDGIIDFDLATRKMEAPDYMQDDCHLGDGLHPNTVGGKRMADAIPQEWFH